MADCDQARPTIAPELLGTNRPSLLYWFHCPASLTFWRTEASAAANCRASASSRRNSFLPTFHGPKVTIRLPDSRRKRTDRCRRSRPILPSLIQLATRNACSALTETRSFSATSQTSLFLPFWTRSSPSFAGMEQLSGRVQSAPRVPSSTSPLGTGTSSYGEKLAIARHRGSCALHESSQTAPSWTSSTSRSVCGRFPAHGIRFRVHPESFGIGRGSW